MNEKHTVNLMNEKHKITLMNDKHIVNLVNDKHVCILLYFETVTIQLDFNTVLIYKHANLLNWVCLTYWARATKSKFNYSSNTLLNIGQRERERVCVHK